MKKIWMMLAAFAMVFLPVCQTRAQAADKIKVVATMSIFSDLVKKIGGDFVDVHTVASPRFNVHFYEPKPSDVLRTSKADLFVHAGLDLEAWRPPLVEASANLKIQPGGTGELDCSQGIALLEIPTQPLSRAQGDIHLYGNPHYWLNPENGAVMARTIAGKLIDMDPSHQKEYEANLAAFLSQLQKKLAQWREQVSAIKGREAIAYHNEWVYFCQFTGIEIKQFMEPKPGIPPTPRQLAFLEGYISNKKIKALIQPTFYFKDAAQALEKRTGIKMYPVCQNVGEIKEAGDFFAFFDYDIKTAVDALTQ